MEVGDLPLWAIGVAKETLNREEEMRFLPEDGIWVLGLYKGTYYDVLDDPVPVQTPPRRLRLDLDLDQGQLSFYDADHMTLIYKHSDSFTENIFPYFCVGPEGDAQTKEIRILAPQTQTKTKTKTQTKTWT